MLKVLLSSHDNLLSPLEPPENARVKILQFVNFKAKPFYLGQLADDIGWSLERTERYVEFLVIEGILRHASQDEIAKMTGVKTVRAYCLAIEANVKLAYQ